jgi:hypothetical protein
MPFDAMEFGLLLSGWVVAFLLGKELQAGFRQWRAARTGQPNGRRQG